MSLPETSPQSIPVRDGVARPPLYTWATWPATLLMVGLWFIARVVVLRWFCDIDLLGDEANYWECARRLELSYHYSGPGMAAVMAAAVALFGDVEWGIRLPAALATAVAALLAASFANRLSGDQRAGFFAALAFLLFPSSVIWSVIMTYDPLYTICWIGATYCAWLIVQRHRCGGFPAGWWALLGVSLGAGFLLKYTIVLLVPGILVYLLIQRRTIVWDKRMWLGIGLALIIFVLAISPVLIWNQQEGWPTIAYLRGHANKNADTPPVPFNPVWGIEFIGAQVGLMGPGAAVLVVAAIAWAWRRRRSDARTWDHRLLVACSGLAPIVFFTLNTLSAKSQGNWAVAAFACLAVLIGLHTARLGQTGPWPPLLRRSWGWIFGFGLFAYAIFLSPQTTARLPVIGPLVPLERLYGASELAAEVGKVREQVRSELGQEPLIIAKTYLPASQLAFYLPDHPTTYCAASYLGGRRTTYDFWDETDLTDPRLQGRPAILVGREPEAWRKALVLGEVKQVESVPVPIFVAWDYQGVQPEARHRGGSGREMKEVLGPSR